jgi:hypothetical protein
MQKQIQTNKIINQGICIIKMIKHKSMLCEGGENGGKVYIKIYSNCN